MSFFFSFSSAFNHLRNVRLTSESERMPCARRKTKQNENNRKREVNLVVEYRHAKSSVSYRNQDFSWVVPQNSPGKKNTKETQQGALLRSTTHITMIQAREEEKNGEYNIPCSASQNIYVCEHFGHGLCWTNDGKGNIKKRKKIEGRLDGL